MGESFANAASNGPLLLAIGAAAIAGLVSFLSPCVLPLVPGYLSYVTGLAGADLDAALGVPPRDGPGAMRTAVAAPPVAAARGRVLAGTGLFVLGFATVFTLLTTLVANIGAALQSHERVLNVVLGILVIVLGLGFLGLIPGLQREIRIRRLPAAGLVGAPVFGALFALSWVPCVGPTLGAVLSSLGLGAPFVAFGLFFRKLLGVFAAVRRNSRWVTRIGGVLLILVGVALVTGGWNEFLIWLRTTFNFDAGTLL
jgi:cytochrome c-type biogenesis protein